MLVHRGCREIIMRPLTVDDVFECKYADLRRRCSVSQKRNAEVCCLSVLSRNLVRRDVWMRILQAAWIDCVCFLVICVVYEAR